MKFYKWFFYVQVLEGISKCARKWRSGRSIDCVTMGYTKFGWNRTKQELFLPPSVSSYKMYCYTRPIVLQGYSDPTSTVISKGDINDIFVTSHCSCPSPYFEEYFFFSTKSFASGLEWILFGVFNRSGELFFSLSKPCVPMEETKNTTKRSKHYITVVSCSLLAGSNLWVSENNDTLRNRIHHHLLFGLY